MTDYKFEGWIGHDQEAAKGNMVWGEFQPKTWEETDVDIQVTHSGVCGTDHHVLGSGWGPTDYPCVVGHEIIGKAVRVGSQVKGIAVGDRVGVGPQADSCLNRGDEKCQECTDGEENYCTHLRAITYNSKFRNGDKTYGGHATYHRASGHFVFKIPDGLESHDAASMLCAGVTVYSPLKYFGCGPGKKVGVMGIGGTGHYAIMFAKALGAQEIVALSRRKDKEKDALALGADRYIATAEEPDWAKDNANQLDLIISCVSSAKINLNDYIGLLRKDGTLVLIGFPEDGEFQISPRGMGAGRKRLAASGIGSPAEIREMLQLAADKKIKSWIEQRPMKEANQAIVDLVDGKPRYRYVLVN